MYTIETPESRSEGPWPEGTYWIKVTPQHSGTASANTATQMTPTTSATAVADAADNTTESDEETETEDEMETDDETETEGG